MSGLELIAAAAAGRGFSLARLRFAYEVAPDGSLLVAIAGSDDVRDWFRNLSTDLVEWPGGGPGLVHLGFWEGCEILHRWFWARARGRELHLHGYSLGGAVAALLGLALRESGREVGSVTTYGAPRFCDSEFARAYPIPLVAYRCGRDPIPTLPRCGRQLVVGERRGPRVAYAEVAPARLLPSSLGWRQALPWRWPWDHLLRAYQTALEPQKGCI
jgi:hypothetical protein